MSFSSSHDSHQHSLETLNLLYEYDDFMESIGRLVDLGCGKEALDLEWWATRTTRGEEQIPLNIQCVGVDCIPSINAKLKNISYQKSDIQNLNKVKKEFDVLWCHNTFQYLLEPYRALNSWWNIASTDGMLALILPQTTNVEYNQQAFALPLGHFYNHTLTTLIYMLAVNGWDCKSGFFKKTPGDPWLHAIVYKSKIEPMDPTITHWYQLLETGLLPDSAESSITKYGYLRQQDLILPWLDKSITWMAQQ